MTRPARPHPIRNELEQLQATRGASAPALVRRARAQAVADEFASRHEPGVPLAVRSKLGEVRFHKIEMKEIQGASCVDIWIGERTEGPPEFRIFNPPTLAQDPEGDIEVGGKMYREDPLAAIAEVILSPVGNPGPAVSDE